MEKAFKGKLNVLIAYYRKEFFSKTQDIGYQQQNFYKYKDVNICSSKTYCAIEKNKITTNDEIYHLIAKKLNKRIYEIDNFDIFIECIIKKIFLLMNDFNDIHCIPLIDNILVYLKSTEGALYYEEYLHLFLVIKNYCAGNYCVLTKAFYIKMMNIKKIFSEKLQEIINLLLYFYAKMNGEDFIIDVFQKIDFKGRHFTPNKLVYIDQLVREKSIVKAFGECNEIKKTCTNNENVNGIILINEATINIICNLDEDMTLSYIDNILCLLKNSTISNQRLSLVYIHIANSYLIMGKYEECLKILSNSHIVDSPMKLHIMICICFCRSMLGIGLSEEHLTLTINDGNDKDYIVYNFYKNNTLSYVRKRDYIMNEVMINLQYCNCIYIHIMKNELLKLCFITKGYKSFMVFESYFFKYVVNSDVVLIKNML